MMAGKWYVKKPPSDYDQVGPSGGAWEGCSFKSVAKLIFQTQSVSSRRREKWRGIKLLSDNAILRARRLREGKPVQYHRASVDVVSGIA